MTFRLQWRFGEAYTMYKEVQLYFLRIDCITDYVFDAVMKDD